MRIVVTGGRDFKDRRWLWNGLDELHVRARITELIEGGADGVDQLAADWVITMNAAAGIEIIRHVTVLAQWNRYGDAAGPIRNRVMADLKPDLVFAVPGGRGTANMVTIAKQREIPVIYLEKMGLVHSAFGAPESAPAPLLT